MNHTATVATVSIATQSTGRAGAPAERQLLTGPQATSGFFSFHSWHSNTCTMPLPLQKPKVKINHHLDGYDEVMMPVFIC